MSYKKVPYEAGRDTSVLQSNRLSDKTVAVKPNLPGSVIVIHGVNDVGVAFSQVEKGLCEGLKARIGWDYVPADYRLPTAKDKDALSEDPDAVYFKRKADGDTYSPVIPFYWGYRESKDHASGKNGQNTDRYGNRLDKDLSKGGGTFANATSTLADMWGKGKSKALGLLDWAQKDATHPVLDNPGRMYMILGARRLAALISMIRDYDEDEAVTIVSHSQGGMLALLAQAFLLQEGLRPADTLIMQNPPYSLVDDVPNLTNLVEGSSGEDVLMHGQYAALEARQTLHARLQTLANIVHGVVGEKHATPAFAALDNQAKHHGMVSAKWKASADRDNRGKVYLYFSPEDMTVALNNVQGIGWQGVPEFQAGWQVQQVPEHAFGQARKLTGRMIDVSLPVNRQPFRELGKGFFQRVFTAKKRPDPRTGTAVLIGQAAPHDFVLHAAGEDDQAHTDTSDSFSSKHAVRAHLPEAVHANRNGILPPEQQRRHIRIINGEPLPKAVPANLTEGAQSDSQGRPGAREEVDPIDAAISITSDYGLSTVWQKIPDPTGDTFASRVGNFVAHNGDVADSPVPSIYKGPVAESNHKLYSVGQHINAGKEPNKLCEVLEVYTCMDGTGAHAQPAYPPMLLIKRKETPDEARLRWQHASSARSFHGAIFGSSENHRNVTAYDVAIGGGKAVTDPLFYAYLCAVADWRLKLGTDKEIRAGILSWKKFLGMFGNFYEAEPEWRKKLIEGNAKYYSSGQLPAVLPTLLNRPALVVCETTNAQRASTTDHTTVAAPPTIESVSHARGVTR